MYIRAATKINSKPAIVMQRAAIRRTLTRDLRFICSHLSTVINVKTAAVKDEKYIPINSKTGRVMQYVTMLSVISAMFCTTIKGWVSNPVQKYVTANPARRTYDGVLRDGYLHQIAAKMKAFAATVNGAKSALTIQVVRITWWY